MYKLLIISSQLLFCKVILSICLSSQFVFSLQDSRLALTSTTQHENEATINKQLL